MAVLEDLVPQLNALLKELDKRAPKVATLDKYYEGNCPWPAAIKRAGVTKAYQLLMPQAEAPWGSVPVDSVQDKLEVTGIQSGDKQVDKAIWRVWQDNAMDAESLLAHNAALVSGRAFALVWPDKDGNPRISLDDATQMVVMYVAGNRRERVAALRRWVDDDEKTYITLYRPDGIYKFVEAEEKRSKLGERIKAGGNVWRVREIDGEAWPLANPFDIVPVVEIAVNRRLKPGAFGYARGEFEHCIGLIDRINLLTFLGLVVAFWLGFPVRAVIGDVIRRDDDDEPIEPFKIGADHIVQFEDPEAKLAEWKAADRGNLSVFAELDQYASITKTPRHYFPIGAQGISNIAEPTIRAFEGAQNAKITGHKGSMGEGWEEVDRLCGLMLPTPVILPPSAALQWSDHESRSLAERADAAVKFASIEGMPWQLTAEVALNLTQDQIARAEAGGASNVIGAMMREAAESANGAAEPESVEQ